MGVLRLHSSRRLLSEDYAFCRLVCVSDLLILPYHNALSFWTTRAQLEFTGCVVCLDRRAHALGYETWMDLTSDLKHSGTYTFDGNFAKSFVMVRAGVNR